MAGIDSEPSGISDRLSIRPAAKVVAVVMAAALLSAGWRLALGSDGEVSFRQVGLSGAKAATSEAARSVDNGLSGTFGADDSGVGRSGLTAPAVGHRFDTLTTAEGVSIERTWHLDVAARTLTSSSVVTNQGPETINLTHRELLPVAPPPWPVDDVVFDQKPDLIETDDAGTHFALFIVEQFAPGTSLTIDYVAPVPAAVELDGFEGTFTAVLVGWADELRAQELAAFAVGSDGEHGVVVGVDNETSPTSLPDGDEDLDPDPVNPAGPGIQADDTSSNVPLNSEVAQLAVPGLVVSSPSATTSKPTKLPSTKSQTLNQVVQPTTSSLPRTSSSKVDTTKSTEPAPAPRPEIPPAGPKRVPSQVHPSSKPAGASSWWVTYRQSSPGTYQAQVFYQSGDCTAALWHGPDGQGYESRGWPNPKSQCTTNHQQVFGDLSGGTQYSVAIEVVNGRGTSSKARHSFTTPS